ncbi:MAG: hypothetical protein Q9172_002031 [Xanthocarpia lactea]
MTIALRGFMELFRLVDRAKELDRRVLTFSVSHGHEMVKIYGHYPVIEGNKTTYWRYPIRKYGFTEREGLERWTAYKFTKNVYDLWMPQLFELISSAVDQLSPMPLVEGRKQALVEVPESHVGPMTQQVTPDTSTQMEQVEGLKLPCSADYQGYELLGVMYTFPARTPASDAEDTSADFNMDSTASRGRGDQSSNQPVVTFYTFRLIMLSTLNVIFLSLSTLESGMGLRTFGDGNNGTAHWEPNGRIYLDLSRTRRGVYAASGIISRLLPDWDPTESATSRAEQHSDIAQCAVPM